MRLIFLLLFGFISFSASHGQQMIQEKAQEYVDAFIKSEFAKVASLTHPELVAKNGGEDYVISDLKAERISSSAEGLLYNSGSVSEPAKIIQHEGEIQAVVPVEYILQLVDTEYKNSSYLLAVSKDEGRTYTFVNLMQFDGGSLREFISNVSPDIIIPEGGDFVEISK